MSFSVHGIAVSSGVAIGRAVLVASSRVDVAHYFVDADQTERELNRVRAARDEVVAEICRVQQTLQDMPGKDGHVELAALLDVHLMLLQDEHLTDGVKHWIMDRRYNAEWALTAQLEVVARQFDEMEDPYLRERKADLEQVVERVLRAMRGWCHLWCSHQRPAVKPRRVCCWMTPLTCRSFWLRTTCRQPTCSSSNRACSQGL
jgi:phosphotransferase system enzyme I (PtsI)